MGDKEYDATAVGEAIKSAARYDHWQKQYNEGLRGARAIDQAQDEVVTLATEVARLEAEVQQYHSRESHVTAMRVAAFNVCSAAKAGYPYESFASEVRQLEAAADAVRDFPLKEHGR